MKILRRIMRRFLKTDLKEKLDWEFEWQRKEWCDLYCEPENNKKVFEYWVKYRHLEEIRKQITINDDTVILDLGCGISTVLHYLPGHRYGIDPLADRYKTIYSYPNNLDIRVGYGESIPFATSFFHLVICSNAIDHIDDAKQTTREIWRVLKPEGHFVLTSEVFATDLGKRNAAHPHSMTHGALRKLIKDFSIVEHWDSPWVGLQNYVLGNPPTEKREHIFLLKKL